MLIEQIKSDLSHLMKGGNAEKRNFLKVIVGELNRGESKNPSDAEVIKLLKGMKQTAVDSGNEFEISVIDEYLPTILSEEEVKTIVDKIVSENNIDAPTKIGMLMGKLKVHENASLIDMKVASTYFRSLF